MKRIYQHTILAVVCLLLLATNVSGAEKQPLRIMPLGDSITAGYTDNSAWKHPFEFGYRSGLYKRLTNANINFTFVGKSTEPLDNRFGDPTHGGKVLPKLDLRKAGQDGHRGYGGWNAVAIEKHITSWMKEDKPDIVLLLIGINGIYPQSSNDLTRLIELIYQADKEVKLIVAQITPLKDFNQDLFNYNKHIRETLVPEYKEKGYQISTVDLYTPFLKDLKDPTSIDIQRLSNLYNHPSNELYDQMAERWFQGIKKMIKK